MVRAWGWGGGARCHDSVRVGGWLRPRACVRSPHPSASLPPCLHHAPHPPRYYHHSVLRTLERGVVHSVPAPAALPRERLAARLAALLSPSHPSAFFHVVTGPPGSGKTTLVREACARMGGGIGYIDVLPAFEVDFGSDLGRRFNFRFNDHVTLFNMVRAAAWGGCSAGGVQRGWAQRRVCRVCRAGQCVGGGAGPPSPCAHTHPPAHLPRLRPTPTPQHTPTPNPPQHTPTPNPPPPPTHTPTPLAGVQAHLRHPVRGPQGGPPPRLAAPLGRGALRRRQALQEAHGWVGGRAGGCFGPPVLPSPRPLLAHTPDLPTSHSPPTHPPTHPPGRPFVLVVDSADRLAREGEGGARRTLRALCEYAREWAREGVITTVFVASEWETVEKLAGGWSLGGVWGVCGRVGGLVGRWGLSGGGGERLGGRVGGRGGGQSACPRRRCAGVRNASASQRPRAHPHDLPLRACRGPPHPLARGPPLLRGGHHRGRGPGSAGV